MSIQVELNEVFEKSDKIVIYKDGQKNEYDNGSAVYGGILAEWSSLIDGAHEMPAFGVSLDRETQKELNSGLWVEFEFPQTYSTNGMPYSKLLINVVSSFYGFNLIRYQKEYGYDGRCFYYDLAGKDMSKFYDYILKI